MSSDRSGTKVGFGLHTGEPSRVTLVACDGPVRLRAGAAEARVDEMEVVSAARATTVQARGGGLRVATVEHLFAALGALGVREGIAIEIEGGELPLLDGGARAWCEAIAEVGARPCAATKRVTRAASFEIGPSVYEFAPADSIDVRVRLDFDDPRLAPGASWTGDPGDFVARIAPARTFALARELDELLRRGLAHRAEPTSVVVVTPDAILCAGRPFEPDEPARHKLLDLIGDSYVHGGPFVGRLVARRPGHAAAHRALARAIAEGIVA